MYPEKTDYGKKITLIMGSGVRFLDFAGKLDEILKKVEPTDDEPVAR